MTITSKFPEILPYLPSVLRQPLSRVPAADIADIRELRLRLGKSLQIICGNTAFAITTQGMRVSPEQSDLMITRPMLDSCFQSICCHSVHSWQSAIRQGFITIAGGCRVGLCGSAVIQNHQLDTIRNISGMNFRIASERIGCAEQLFQRVKNDLLQGGLLIAGAPASGKTTILRDLARLLGNRHRLCILDERGEIAAVQNGMPQFSLGVQTDVFDGYPKAEGVEIAVRVMSPEYLICDEIGDETEIAQLLQSMHTGVKIIATAHAGSLNELRQRPQIKRMLQSGIFRCAVMLGTGELCGQVLSVESLRGAVG